MTRCSVCERAPVVRSSPRCTYCGGAIVEVAEPAALPIPPVLVAGAKSAPVPVAMPAPPVAAPTVRLKPATTAPELEPPPPVWLQILMIPFASPGRIAVLGLVALVALSILGISRFIDRERPSESSGHLTIYPPGGDAAPAPPFVANDEPVAAHGAARESRAAMAVNEICVGLKGFAERYGYFPSDLGPELPELSEFGEFGDDLKLFDGGTIASYQRALTSDGSGHTAHVEAVVQGGGKRVSCEVQYWPPR